MKLEIDCNHPGRHGHVTGLGPIQFSQAQIIANVLVSRAERVGLYGRLRLLKFQSDTIGGMVSRCETIFVTTTLITDGDKVVEHELRERATKDFEFTFYPITKEFMQLLSISGKVDITKEPEKFGNETFDSIAERLIKAGYRAGPWKKMYVDHIARKKKRVMKKR